MHWLMVQEWSYPGVTVAIWLNLYLATDCSQGCDEVTPVADCWRAWHALALACCFPLCDDPINPTVSGRGNDESQDKCLTPGSSFLSTNCKPRPHGLLIVLFCSDTALPPQPSPPEEAVLAGRMPAAPQASHHSWRSLCPTQPCNPPLPPTHLLVPSRQPQVWRSKQSGGQSQLQC